MMRGRTEMPSGRENKPRRHKSSMHISISHSRRFGPGFEGHSDGRGGFCIQCTTRLQFTENSPPAMRCNALGRLAALQARVALEFLEAARNMDCRTSVRLSGVNDMKSSTHFEVLQ